MSQDPHRHSDAATSARRSFGGRLVLLLAGAAAALALALFSQPAWLRMLPLDDVTLLHIERTQRRLRYEIGLPMPSEPDLERLSERLAAAGVREGAPILVRIFKKEFE